MIKLTSLLKEDREKILIPRRDPTKRNENRLIALKKEIHSEIKNGIYEGDLDLQQMGLTSLEPLGLKNVTVTGRFLCSNNNLTSLGGAPESVEGDFYCHNNNLTSLEGAPKSVGGSFFCYKNPLLTSLEGAPKSVGGSFDCSGNNLKSLEGAPKSVGRNFGCNGNKLTSLEGAPESVGGYFDCSYQRNGVIFSEEDVRKVSDVKGDIAV